MVTMTWCLITLGSLLVWPALGWVPQRFVCSHFASKALRPLRSLRLGLPSVAAAAASVENQAENGVSLTGLTSVEEDSAWLANAVKDLLDDEWIPQPCHTAIGAEVASIYKAARAAGIDDLNGLVVEVGTGLSSFDMGAAFVGPWDVANALSDLTLVRLGREGCGCNTAMRTPHFNSGAVQALTGAHLSEHFPRYKFLAAVLDGTITWTELSIVVGLVMGYRPTGAILEGGSEEVDASLVVNEEWLSLTSKVPPLLDAASPLVARLELELPEEGSEGREVLEEFVKLAHGEVLTQLATESGDGDFTARATLVQWLHQNDFLAMDDAFA